MADNGFHVPCFKKTHQARTKGLLFTGCLPADYADTCAEILNKTFVNHNIAIH